MPTNIAVLISGTGRTLLNLIEKINNGTLNCEIKLVIASTPNAPGLQYAEQAQIPIEIIERANYPDNKSFSEANFKACNAKYVRYIVMAGYTVFLEIPDKYMNRVLNIHPSLIPAFSGQGFYGRRVHEQVIEYGVKVTGCTVHFVTNEYDRGPIILQKVINVAENDTAATLMNRVFFEAECEAYPEALQMLADQRITVEGRKVKISPLPPPQ